MEKTRPTVGPVTLPRDQDWVKDQVVVDFQENLKDIAQQTTDTFTGFRPKEQAFYAYRYDDAIEEARKAAGSTTSAPATK